VAAEADSQRLDKWLFIARFLRSREKAADLVRSGHVRVNGVRTDAPAKAIRIGDALTIALDRQTRLVRVLGLGERRGPATEAQELYEEITGT
jgi:ribosome-associated heat shock protein Hsp15